ncbi:MAG: hypothetical protein HY673_10200 [Chloroflexi bacterium]|nr:hypothetical protein [Chloroflexota bacterium]
MTKTESYILDFAAYGPEPLYVTLGALIEEGLCSVASEAIVPLLELTRSGYIEWSYHSGLENANYERVTKLNQEDLVRYVARHEGGGFREYPEGGEYYLKTTDKGCQILEAGGSGQQ